MKIKILLVGLFFASAMQAQTTTISFEEPSQKIEYDKKTKDFTIKLEIKNLSNYSSTSIINLELFSDLENEEIPFLPSKKLGRDIVILPSNYSGFIDVIIPFDEQKMGKIGIITFELKKKGVNPNFLINQKYHTVSFQKKEETPTAKIGISSSGVTELELDYRNDTTIELPFKITTEGDLPVEKDGISIKLKIDGFDDINQELNSFKVIGKESKEKIVLSNKKDPKAFGEFLKNLIDREKIKVEIEKIENESKKKVVSEEESNSISFTTKSKSKNRNRYNFYIGTNFDLKDQFEATSFYAEIDAWLPELIKDKWGIRAGIYKNNNSRTQEEFADIENVPEIINQTVDSITFQNKRVRSVPSVNIENFGLYFQALFKLIDTDNFTGHLAAHFEAIERNETFTFSNDDLITLGTSTISVDSLNRDRRLQFSLTRERDFTRRYYDAYYGLGFPMNYRNEKNTFSIFLNPVFGYGDPGLVIRDGRDIDDSNKFFGIFEFSLIEEKFGIKLSGEIRKYFGFLQDPIISINLSKKINLSSLFDTKEED